MTPEQMIAKAKEHDAAMTPGPYTLESCGIDKGGLPKFALTTRAGGGLSYFAYLYAHEGNAEGVLFARNNFARMARMLEAAMVDLDCIRLKASHGALYHADASEMCAQTSGLVAEALARIAEIAKETKDAR